MKQYPNAFTRIELLIVIVCIGILIGLLLPALPYRHEDSRRIQCALNLKNFSLAAIQHENAKGRMPCWAEDFGTFGLDGPLSDPSNPIADPKMLAKHRKIGTWAISLLPYLDAQPTYEVWTEDRYPIVGGGSPDDSLSTGVSGEGFRADAAPHIGYLYCPSSETVESQFGPNSYIANTGIAFSVGSDPTQTRLIHTPKGDAETISFADSLLPKYGAMNSRLDARTPGASDGTSRVPVGPAIRLDDFEDGQGYTVLFSESLSALPWHRSGFTDQKDLLFENDPDEVVYPEHNRFTNGLVWHSVDWEQGGKSLPIHQINGTMPGGELSAEMITPANAADLARPSSNHIGGVNVGMADGGTRFISDSIDLRVWQALLTPAGEEVIDEDSI